MVGGYHLADAEDAKLNATMEDLRRFEPKVLLAGHCTGWRFKCHCEGFAELFGSLFFGEQV